MLKKGQILPERAKHRVSTYHTEHWVSVLLLLIGFAQMLTSLNVKSAAYDEPAHVFRGCLVWRYKSYAGRPVHWLTGLSCLLAPELPVFDEPPLAQVTYRNTFFETLDFPLDTLLFPARVLSIHLTLLLGAVLYRWGKDMTQGKGGLLALAMFIYDPNMLAHGRLVSTDIPPTLLFTLCLYLYHRALTIWKGPHSEPSTVHIRWSKGILYFLGAFIALWLALLSKPTAPVLLPLLGLMTLLCLDYKRGWRAWLPQLGMVIFLSVIGTGLYGLLTGAPLWKEGMSIWAVFEPLPRRLAAALRRLLRAPQDSRGWPTYMLGQRSFKGWHLYFPLLFLVKTPLPLILTYPLGMITLTHKRKWRLLVAFSLPLWMLLAYTQLAINIGYRHMLPAVPLVILASTYGMAQASRRKHGGGRYNRWIVGALLLWIGWGSLRTYPDYLAYFNEIARGPEHGINFFTDSNLDWGQDLKKLHMWMEEHNVDWVYLSYFGDVDPATYGIKYLKMESHFGHIYLNDFTPMAPPPGVYAISATHLTGQYLWENPSIFSWFRQQKPVAQIGHAIWVYVVSPDPDPPRWAAICTSPSPEPVYILEGQYPLDYVEALRKGIGEDKPLERLIHFDCRRGWPLAHEDDGTGWLLVPSLDGDTPMALPPVGQRTLAYRQKNYHGVLLYEVFRWWSPISSTVKTNFEEPVPLVSAGNLVRLEDAHISTQSATPGETVIMSLIWRVLASPQQPVSFMAHVQHSSGQTVAVDDGNAIPPIYWQPGDRLLQVHHLPLPPDAPAGPYTLITGVYTVPEIEHLPLISAEGDPLGETISVAEISVHASR